MSNGDRIENLRLLLTREQKRHVKYSEALDIGETLVEFFSVLAEDAIDEQTTSLVT